MSTGARLLIREGDLTEPGVLALLRAHVEEATGATVRESAHALDSDALRAPEITFWSVWLGETLVGCGALKELEPGHGEVKSMHTAVAHRGRGVARHLLAHIVAEAEGRSYERLSLETGTMVAFSPARALYSAFGFTTCGPFGDYREDPNTVFMTLNLKSG